MPTPTIAHLDTATLTNEHLDQLRALINADPTSSLAVVLQRIIFAHEDGIGVDVLSSDAELTPNEAAHLLKVSRPHLLSFMDTGALPFRRVGTHRRIAMSDLKVFMQEHRRGKEVLANALHSTSQPGPTVELTKDEIDELNDL
ncbi:helix-turn-helix domain-containing protein [Corynebacterium cystitidis]|uniref:DNA binding domain-containing protein, excisionase family n=1 Tax=Corynebacterium cystitidis DSM 20524 TaxID=1121357 RepID=A0A1H9R348_9CORY|nr:helix-turn-helix domain-containing protein [Corynebacterium cystitidis]WJY81584.1 Helix-turn-helix domain protein [Corynebacterium cystitidis DSM 20524]SER66479.1 DNA binding domain-containing protein, excisionase family [Corynebacterium cystitidis DSM 20524]SNV85904.1 ArsR DNA-binding transcription regulator [Corynebacterium cystitidis]